MQLSLADLVAYEVPLTPREAASLTLAVAEHWDCWSAHHERVRSLPSKNAILLHQSGTVSFVPHAPAGDEDYGAALSSLLSALLGLDEDADDEKPFVYPAALRRAVAHAGGLAGADALRTALMRFASADPVVLRSVFWRAVRVIQAGPAESMPMSFEERRNARPRTERRRRGMAVSDLRREIRLLEQEIYESRPHAADVPAAARIARPKLAIGIAAVCSLVVVTISLARTVFAPDARQDSATAEQLDTPLPARAMTTPTVSTPTVAPAVLQVSTPAASTSTPAHRPLHSPRLAAKSRVPARRITTAPVPPPARRPPTAPFAGGTRGVAWSTRSP
jgi:hypothetical protein